MTLQVVRTRGGVAVVRDDAAGEVMHPGVGPLVEAAELYVAQSRLGERLRAAPAPALVLFDAGLGAGSNALAARAASEGAPAGAARLELVSFERDLGALELALAHGAEFGLTGEAAAAARALLACGRHETPRTLWRLRRGDLLESLQTEGARADVIYWDPYSSRANPALWTTAAFAAARRCAGPRCTLFTYSASTATRVALLLAGWAVGAGAATGSKAETTAAAVDVADLARPLDARWLRRLALPGAPLPPDAPPGAASHVAALPQFVAPPRGR